MLVEGFAAFVLLDALFAGFSTNTRQPGDAAEEAVKQNGTEKNINQGKQPCNVPSSMKIHIVFISSTIVIEYINYTTSESTIVDMHCLKFHF